MPFSTDSTQGVDRAPQSQPPSKADRPIPIYGQKYRHFKGDVYEIAATPVIAGRSYQQGDPVSLFLQEEEEDCFGTFTSSAVAGETIVFYRKGKAVFARSLSNFLEILSDGSDDRASNYYRFTLIEDVDVSL